MRRIPSGRVARGHFGGVTSFSNKIPQAAQGRYTYATPEEAQRVLDAIENPATNSPAVVAELYANAEVRPVECWPNHFDPKTRWFDD